ncbi:2-oxoglutarate and iron-dependent oxygenase domain-containing protein [Stigmatella hybrida]|uniref:2-oxoglutarate and iron-dependent oxygenase domain-containing protein n=1 Tax=Stigmatella hybrida TaxID=394097 RepID=UPI001CDB4462|nr:2-oxoglutarate and iron-dependent oxygenase domain-containing protein [Stigmatella hybrida]
MSEVRVLHRSDVPCLDILAYREKGDASGQVERARQALETLGFLVLERSPIDPELVKRCYAIGKEFFSLPLEKKLEIDHRSVDQKAFGDVGYYSYLTETAMNHAQADLKEFIHLGPLIDAAHPMSAHYPLNPWPTVPTEFRPLFEKLFRQLTECAHLVLRLVGTVAGMDTHALDNVVLDGKHVLRMLHYPAVEERRAAQGAMRAAPHTGINMIGLQLPASHPGLQFCTPAGEWVVLDSELQDYTTVNIGEILAMIKGGGLRPTLHQVVNPQTGTDPASRWAIVFFFVPNPLKTLSVHEENSGNVRSVQAGELLLERFRKIGTRVARTDS